MKYLLAILATIGASIAVPAATAQEPAPLDQIIVTGSRSPLAISAIGSAVTVISRDDIDRRQARYVTDMLRGVPGFAVSQSGVSGSQTQVRVRGAEANHVLVLVDGVRANDPASDDDFRWEFLTTANIERIEIVRGPQSSLWGSDAVAAVVHVITRDADDLPAVGGYVEGGSHDTLNTAFRGGLGNDIWSLALGIERLATAGENIARTGNEKDDSDISTGTLSGRWNPGQNLALDFSLRSVDAYSQYDGVDYFTSGLPADSDVATDTRQNFVRLGGTVGANDTPVKHRLNASWFDSDNSNLLDGLADISTAAERLTLTYQADIRIQRNLLSLALERENSRFRQRGATGFGDPNQDQRMETSSLVADFQGRVSEKVTVLLSARYDHNSAFDDAVTGRVSVSWLVTDGTRLRANAGTGRKNPTFIERFGYYPGQFVGNDALKPERSTSIDAGLEHRFGDAVDFDVTLFHQDLKDEINGLHCPDPWPALCTAANMSGTSKRSGVEAGLRWLPTERFSVGGNYTYTDSQDTNSASEWRRPRHAGSVDMRIGFLDQRGQITVTANYGGTRHDVFYPPWPDPRQIVALKNYWVVDIAAQFMLSPGVKLFARTTNLLDTEYELVYGYRTPGRGAYAGIQAEFGR